MNLRIITINYAAGSIGYPLKIDFRADCTHESIPTAWELNELFDNRNNVTIKKLFVVIRSKAATTFCAS